MVDQAELGRALFYGIRRKRNYRKAFPLLLRAAEEGRVHWQYLAGYALANGLGVKRNLKQASNGMNGLAGVVTSARSSIWRSCMSMVAGSNKT